jgi:predicted deacetylase
MGAGAIVSVHDVMPSTLPRVQRILELLEEFGVPPATLLVVPGRDWTAEGLEALRGFASRGHTLAGHGWIHRSSPDKRDLYHRLHGLLISRNVAEHLSRPARDLMDLVQECYNWFPGVDLPAPKLYVPPAWALGSLRAVHLRSLPFRWYEVLRGYIDAETGRAHWLPLTGFEADTGFRRVSLKLWNGLNVALARTMGRPVRISIHPDDLDLLLGDDLRRILRNSWRFSREETVLTQSVRGKGA